MVNPEPDPNPHAAEDGPHDVPESETIEKQMDSDEGEIVELQLDDDSDSAENPADSDEQDPVRFKNSLIWTHAGFLLLSIFVITMSITMRVPGQERVYLPGFSEPLPGMCMSKNVTGLDCPGCGLTRSFISLGHGQIKRAWQFNPSGLALYVFVALQIPWRIIQLIRLLLGYPELWVGKFNWVLWAIAAFMFIQWIAKLIIW